MSKHQCELPEWTWLRVHQWECGLCGRVYSPGTHGWVEVRGGHQETEETER